jgi:tetratricopeptide (TPR) repeat protein
MNDLPPPPPFTPRRGPPGRIDALHEAARAHLRQGRVAEAERAYRSMLDESAQAGEAVSAELHADVHHWAAVFYRDVGRATEAEDLARRAIVLEEQAGRDAVLANHHMFLSDLLQQRGALQSAIEHAERALSYQRASLGPDHGETAFYASVVARLRRRGGADLEE